MRINDLEFSFNAKEVSNIYVIKNHPCIKGCSDCFSKNSTTNGIQAVFKTANRIIKCIKESYDSGIRNIIIRGCNKLNYCEERTYKEQEDDDGEVIKIYDEDNVTSLFDLLKSVKEQFQDLNIIVPYFHIFEKEDFNKLQQIFDSDLINKNYPIMLFVKYLTNDYLEKCSLTLDDFKMFIENNGDINFGIHMYISKEIEDQYYDEIISNMEYINAHSISFEPVFDNFLENGKKYDYSEEDLTSQYLLKSKCSCPTSELSKYKLFNYFYQKNMVILHTRV